MINMSNNDIYLGVNKHINEIATIKTHVYSDLLTFKRQVTTKIDPEIYNRAISKEELEKITTKGPNQEYILLKEFLKDQKLHSTYAYRNYPMVVGETYDDRRYVIDFWNGDISQIPLTILYKNELGILAIDHETFEKDRFVFLSGSRFFDDQYTLVGENESMKIYSDPDILATALHNQLIREEEENPILSPKVLARTK